MEAKQDQQIAPKTGLLDLPGELRNKIYELVLLPGVVIVPPKRTPLIVAGPDRWHGRTYKKLRFKQLCHGGVFNMSEEDCSSSPPAFLPLAPGLLLGVCRLIHNETVRFFFSRNKIMFYGGSFSKLGLNFFDTGDPDAAVDFEQGWRHVRSAGFAFDMRDIAAAGEDSTPFMVRRHLMTREEIHDLSRDRGGDDQVDRILAMHSSRGAQLQHIWHQKIYFIMSLGQPGLPLDRLELDFTYFYCQSGCCRRITKILHDRRLGDPAGWSYGPPRVVAVSGWLNEYEKKVIGDALEPLLRSNTEEILFVGPSRREHEGYVSQEEEDEEED